VDDQQHVITHIQADFADKRDSACLPAIIEKTQQRLEEHHLQMQEVAADTNYSSGENYELLETKASPHGFPFTIFQPHRKGSNIMIKLTYILVQTASKLPGEKPSLIIEAIL